MFNKKASLRTLHKPRIMSLHKVQSQVKCNKVSLKHTCRQRGHKERERQTMIRTVVTSGDRGLKRQSRISRRITEIDITNHVLILGLDNVFTGLHLKKNKKNERRP